MSDDAERARYRLDDSEDDDSRNPDAADGGAVSHVGLTTTVSSYPTTAAVYYGVRRQNIFGTETEGSSGVSSTITGTFLALNLGTAIPPVGTQVIVTRVAQRWTFRFDG